MSEAMSPGKIRRLQATATAEGHFAILAIDHRDSMRVLLDPDRPDRVEPATLSELKMALLAAVGTRASAVMLDPEYSAGQAITTGVLPGATGFLVALEAQGYLGDPEDRRTTLLTGWSVEKAARLGATGVKLLIFYHPDAGTAAEYHEEVVRSVIVECARHDLPLFLEPMAYPLDRDRLAGDDRRRVVVESARRLGSLGPDVLKLQFPASADDRSAWRDACSELADAVPVPWALLSMGEPYEVFAEQMAVASEAGCSGFMAGRALWGEVVGTTDARRKERIAELVVPRFEHLVEVAAAGRPWFEGRAMPDVDETWFRTF